MKFLILVILLCISNAGSAFPGDFHINCGASEDQKIESNTWTIDDGYINTGNKSALTTPGLLPIVQNVRYFPDKTARKYCYVIPVVKGGKYIVRTTYYYGNYDKIENPPIFDQIIDGSKWSTVNTTANYAQGLTTYFEIIVVSHRRGLSVCVARNNHTLSTNPFISAIEVRRLENSIYNATDFNKYALSTVSRHLFGNRGHIVSYPDDPFNRYWEPFMDGNPVVESRSNVSSIDFWNLPPIVAFQRGVTTSRGQKLVVEWPPINLPKTSYYISLYFQDNRTPSLYSWRVFNVSINNQTFYRELNVSTDGAMVYSTIWPLSGKTIITLTPHSDAPVGPIINAGEALMVVPLLGRTLSRDVIAMEYLANSLTNKPADWHGDPCLPHRNSWTGVGCSSGKLARVTSLVLKDRGITGLLPRTIGKLTAIRKIILSGNKISGNIPPEMSQLKELKYLHLDNNQLNGTIPASLGNLRKIHEIYLQNNNLQGQLPESLKVRTGIDIKTSPGNNIN